jgi:excisionase family DNA binding protein
MEENTTPVQTNPTYYEILDVRGAAKLLKVTEKTIYRRVQAGLMPYRRFGPRLIRFTREDLLGSMTRRATRAEILG